MHASTPVSIRSLLLMAAPVMLASMSTPLVGAIDLAVLGRLNDPALLGGVAAANIVVNFLFYAFNFLRSSTTGMSAQALGAGKLDEFYAVVLRACLLAGFFGVLAIIIQVPIGWIGFYALGITGDTREAAETYFHIRVWSSPMLLLIYCFMGWVFGKGAMVQGLMLQILLNVANIVLSIAFVWGLNWGVAGAAWATVLAETVTALTGAIMLLVGVRSRFAAAIAAVPNWGRIRSMALVNGDLLLRSFTLITVIAIFVRIGAGFGETILAANVVLMTIFYMSGAVMDGLATASQQLSGRFYGARDKAGFSDSIRLVLACSVWVCVGYTLILMLGQPYFISGMSSTPDVRAAMESFYGWTVLTPLLGTAAFIFDGVYIGASWTSIMRNMMLISAGLFLACATILVPLMGNHGLWAALMVFMLARGVLLFWQLPHRIRLSFS